MGDGPVQVVGAAAAQAALAQVEIIPHAAAGVGGARADDPFLQGRQGHHRLEHRARREHAVEGQVHHGLVLVGQQVVVVLPVPGDALHQLVHVVGGVGGAGQHPKGVHIQHHRRARGTVARVSIALDILLQREVGHPLQVRVQGELHVAALLGLPGDGGALHGAGLVGEDSLLSPVSPQLLLEGRLNAAAAVLVGVFITGGVVLRIVQVPLFLGLVVLLLGDSSHVAHHVGGQGAVLPVIALGGDPGLDAGPLLRPLADDPHRLRGHVLGDDVGVGAGVAVLGHGVAHGQDIAHVPAGVTPAVVGVRQLVHAVLGGGVLRQAQKLL